MPSTTPRRKPGQPRIRRLPADRLAVIREVCGKYAHVPEGSEEFARRKRDEVDRENRAR
jgi:hypothetical protein